MLRLFHITDVGRLNVEEFNFCIFVKEVCGDSETVAGSYKALQIAA